MPLRLNVSRSGSAWILDILALARCRFWHPPSHGRFAAHRDGKGRARTQSCGRLADASGFCPDSVIALGQLLWLVPLVEVTSRGIRLRIRAPIRRSGLLFVPVVKRARGSSDRKSV